MIDRIRERRRQGRGLIAWLIDKAGWRVLGGATADAVAVARRSRHGEDDPVARGADAVGDAIGQVGDGTE
jgi:hypothetical protein